MALNWASKDYFSMLLAQDKRAHAALEMLVDDLHTDKERTISHFLCHSGSEDFLWGLVRLLGNNNSRVAGNSAYILGTLAESEMGCYRVISLTAAANPESKNIMPDLTNMLTFDDAESVMNAAGTMGTLAESHEGRLWMLSENCLQETLTHITVLLGNNNMWTASNAALVLARLTIAEEGCEKLLCHSSSQHILSQLIGSLGVDEAGRGMNAAFAIGRLCDIEQGRTRLLGQPDSEKMISQLALMLCCDDPGASKNACFALSCLATNKEGHQRLLKNVHSDQVIKMLSELLAAEDGETGWFAAMTLHTLASQPKGCLRLRDHPNVVPSLKAIQEEEEVNSDLQEEVLQTLEILKRLDKPHPPTVNVLETSVQVKWNAMTTKSGFDVRYHLFEGGRCIYSGKDLVYTVDNLLPCTTYSFQVRASTEGDESPLSDPVTMTTEEAVPGIPHNLRIIAVTTTQMRVVWDLPEGHYGHIKGYYVYNGGSQVEFTQELSSIISGLNPNTSYEIQVCAATSKGKGPKDTVSGTTSELGAHAPAKPEVLVRGRNEMHITWKPPEVPLGRTSRYDLSMNGEVIYSGMELHYTARRLRPDTDYIFTVSALTNEGKCESKPTRKRTAKDEYEGERAPLYQAPPKKEGETEQLRAASSRLSKRRKSSGSVSAKSNREDQEKSANLKMTNGITVNKREEYEMTIAGGWFPDISQKPHSLANTPIGKDSDSSPGQPDNSKRTGKDKSEDKAVKKSISRLSEPLERSKTAILSPAWEYTLRSYEFPQRSKTTLSAKSRSRKSTRETYTAADPSTGDIFSRGSPTKDVNTLSKPKRPDLPKPAMPSTSPTKSVMPTNSSPRKSVGASESSTVKISGASKSSRRTLSSPDSAVSDHVAFSPRIGTTRQVLEPHSIVGRDRKSSIASDSLLSKPDKWLEERGLSNTRSFGSNPSLVNQEESLPETDHMRPNKISPKRSPRTRSLEAPAILRTNTTLGSGLYKPPRAQKVKPPGLVDLDSALPLPQRAANEPPAYVQRANTFIANHNSRSTLRRSLDKMSTGSANSSHRSTANSISSGPRSWAPNLPSTRQLEQSHNKFVPMQYRTQPANLPGPARVGRQTTSLGMMEHGFHPLNLHSLSRSNPHIEFHKQVYLDGTPVDSDADGADSDSLSGLPADHFNLHKTQDRMQSDPAVGASSTTVQNKSNKNISSKSTKDLGATGPGQRPGPNHTAISKLSLSQLSVKTLQSAR